MERTNSRSKTFHAVEHVRFRAHLRISWRPPGAERPPVWNHWAKGYSWLSTRHQSWVRFPVGSFFAETSEKYTWKYIREFDMVQMLLNFCHRTLQGLSLITRLWQPAMRNLGVSLTTGFEKPGCIRWSFEWQSSSTDCWLFCCNSITLPTSVHYRKFWFWFDILYCAYLCWHDGHMWPNPQHRVCCSLASDCSIVPANKKSDESFVAGFRDKRELVLYVVNNVIVIVTKSKITFQRNVNTKCRFIIVRGWFFVYVLFDWFQNHCYLNQQLLISFFDHNSLRPRD